MTAMRARRWYRNPRFGFGVSVHRGLTFRFAAVKLGRYWLMLDY